MMYICKMKQLLPIIAIFAISCTKGEKYTCKNVKDGQVITEQKRFNASELAQYNLTPIFWKIDTNLNRIMIYPECK
jgi:hypothetical protein